MRLHKSLNLGYSRLKKNEIKMKKNDAKEHLKKIREIVSKKLSSIFRKNKEDVIKTLRETREKIWKEKIAIRH